MPTSKTWAHDDSWIHRWHHVTDTPEKTQNQGGRLEKKVSHISFIPALYKLSARRDNHAGF